MHDPVPEDVLERLRVCGIGLARDHLVATLAFTPQGRSEVTAQRAAGVSVLEFALRTERTARRIARNNAPRVAHSLRASGRSWNDIRALVGLPVRPRAVDTATL